MNMSTEVLIDKNVENEALVGPVNNKKSNSVYFIKVYQNLANRQSNYIGVDILNDKKEYIFGYGKELWWEEGYDSDGRWTEGTKETEMKITLKDKGNHYFRISPDKKKSTMRVKVEQKMASSLPHFILGIITIIFGIALVIYKNKENILNNMADS
ncbi:MAG: hypothetical protein OEV42_07565 [Deltaproteobacteria bacterium]|nr:hypothetical protein [Deltaproteobacteria bacterium]